MCGLDRGFEEPLDENSARPPRLGPMDVCNESMPDTLNGTLSDANKTVLDQVTTLEEAFYLSTGISGALLNALVMFIALRHIDTDDKPRQILVMNMTFADLLFCVVYSVTRPYLALFPVYLCRPYYWIIWIVQMCSCVNLLWLNLDKLLYIQFPLHYYSMVSRKRVMLLTVATWAILVAYILILNLTMTVQGSCLSIRFPQIAPYMLMCIFYVVVIVGSFTISAIIFFIAQTTTRMEQRARTKLFQRLFFLFSSTLWTFITCIPFRVLYLTMTLCGACHNSVTYLLTDFSFKLLVGGSVINPVITIATQRVYRARMLSYVQMWKEVVSSTNGEESISSTSKRRQSSRTTIILENAPLTTAL